MRRLLLRIIKLLAHLRRQIYVSLLNSCQAIQSLFGVKISQELVSETFRKGYADSLASCHESHQSTISFRLLVDIFCQNLSVKLPSAKVDRIIAKIKIQHNLSQKVNSERKV